jgi:hypothetical protein
MQTPYPNQVSAANLFSRERRKQRMLQFLETFESRSWRCAPEFSFLVPVAKETHREQAMYTSGDERP